MIHTPQVENAPCMKSPHRDIPACSFSLAFLCLGVHFRETLDFRVSLRQRKRAACCPKLATASVYFEQVT